MYVTLLNHTPNPEETIAQAAKLCYSDAHIDDLIEDMDDEQIDKFIETLSSYGHESPIEHVTFTFGIEGVSRSLLAQLTRHRIASYSVQSQRYVSYDNIDCVIPPAISNDDELMAKYLEFLKVAGDTYKFISNKLTETYVNNFELEGKTGTKYHQMAEKMAIEDARYVLPNAMSTKIIMTMNARSLLNFFKLRCCNRAQWEIRELAWAMLYECWLVAPSIFSKAGPSCLRGKCTEGRMCCGKAHEIKNRSDSMKESIKL